MISLILSIFLLGDPTTHAAARDPELFILTGKHEIVRIDAQGHAGPPIVRDFDTIAGETTNGFILATRRSDIMLVPLDGSPPRMIYHHGGEVRFASLSSEGATLAFSSVSDGKIDLSSRDPAGRFAPAIAIADGYGPSFSADGRSILFEGKGGLKRFDRQTKSIDDFLPKFSTAYTVHCSRDGRFIAFSMDRALYAYDTGDKSVRKLTAGDAYDRFPSFAGDQIFFFRQTKTGKRQIIARKIDGTGDERIMFEGDVELVCALLRT